ncbi:hypothetical protein RUM43_000006 [Polyplax serrata]|uniref:Uncharacterized protein n=1 Tax=Polyplax serrata TaxID=468196 RepID=A0AAN8SBS9_POLSC
MERSWCEIVPDFELVAIRASLARRAHRWTKAKEKRDRHPNGTDILDSESDVVSVTSDKGLMIDIPLLLVLLDAERKDSQQSGSNTMSTPSCLEGILPESSSSNSSNDVAHPISQRVKAMDNLRKIFWDATAIRASREGDPREYLTTPERFTSMNSLAKTGLNCTFEVEFNIEDQDPNKDNRPESSYDASPEAAANPPPHQRFISHLRLVGKSFPGTGQTFGGRR